MKNGNNIIKRPIKAESAIVHWNKLTIALKAQQGRTLQVFDLASKQKLKATQMNEDVIFWKWISETTLGLVTDKSVYHWNVMDGSELAPSKMFDRNDNLAVGGSTTSSFLTNMNSLAK
jgi:clathrin heavy chain